MKELFLFFKDNPPTFAKPESTQMICKGKKFDYSTEIGVNKLFSADVILKYKLMDFHEMESKDQVKYLVEYIDLTFRPERLERKERSDKVKKAVSDSVVKLPSTDWLLDNLLPARPLGETKKESGFKFVDKITNRVTDYDYHSVYYALCRDLEEKDVKHFMQNFVQIKPYYNPHGSWELEEIKGAHNLYLVNTYKPPYWREIEADLEACLPDKIEKLMVHLFPCEESREFVYSWMYHSLHSRSQTFLYLCGGQGSGKNTLAKLLMALHGDKNSSAPKQDSLKGRFNSFLRDKRFVFLDEYNCRRRLDKDLLKSIINDRIQVEAKGQDHEDIDVYASFMIANNSREAIGLEPIDRRFSVPDISDENLLDKYSPEWINDFYMQLRRPEYVGQFAKWLLEQYKDTHYTAIKPFQKKRYESIVLDTARAGISFTLERIFAGEDTEFRYEFEKEKYERKFRGRKYPHITDWQQFFKEVNFEEEKLVTFDDNKSFTLNKEFSPCE